MDCHPDGHDAPLVRSSDEPVAGPAVVTQLLERDDAGTDRVEMDVVDLACRQGAGRVVRATKAGLEDVADRAAESLVLVGEGRLERMHPFAEIAPRSSHDQVEVIGHDRIGMQLPGEAMRNGKNGFHQDLLGGIGLEDGLTEFGAVVDVIGALVRNEPSASRHQPIILHG